MRIKGQNTNPNRHTNTLKARTMRPAVLEQFLHIDHLLQALRDHTRYETETSETSCVILQADPVKNGGITVAYRCR